MGAQATELGTVEDPILAAGDSPADDVLDLGPEPDSRRVWLRSMWEHRAVAIVLARKDFQARYKRASLGVAWAVAIPIVQAAVMIFVFSHFIHIGRGVSYGAYVLSGIMGWSYFAQTLVVATTSIVDGTTLTDKVWFPRAILPLVPCLSSLVGLAVAMCVLVVGAPLLGAGVHLELLMLIPACMLLVAFTIALTSVLATLQVYYRDVRFIASAALLVWLYATPIMYPASRLGGFGRWLDVNPMTGIIGLFHLAVLGSGQVSMTAIAISVVTTLLLLIAGIEGHRRHDRLFVDLL